MVKAIFDQSHKMCGQNTLRFIQPNCSNAPLHILSNGNGVATREK